MHFSDISSPVDNSIVGKTFTRCEIIGPATVFFVGSGHIQDCMFMNCDFIAAKKGASIHNAIKLNDCVIRNCLIYGVTFIVPPSLYGAIPEEANWITEFPNEE